MSLLLAFGASPPAAAPFNGRTLENPQPERQSGQTTIAASLLVTLLAVVAAAAPFAPAEWANPVRQATHSAQLAPNLLVSTLHATTQQPSNRQTEWANPQFSGRQAADPYPNLQGTTLRPAVAAPFVQVAWEAPRTLNGQAAWLAPNPLASTLYATTQQPQNRQADWPIPIVRAVQTPHYPPNLLASTQYQSTQLPIGESEQQMPIRPWVRESHIPPNVQLPLAPEVNPFYNADWPVPRQPPSNVKDQLPQSLPQLAAVALPVQPFAWPVPQPRVVQQPFDFPSLLQDEIATPFAENHWPNPILPWVRQAQIPPNVLIPLRPETNPFYNPDWPTPRLAPSNVKDQLPQGLPQQLSAVSLPFAQSDWPNPTRLGVQAPFDFQNLQQDSIAAPFNQLDWPNPACRAVLQTDQPSIALPLDASKGVPFSQADWPNPTRLGVQAPFDFQNLQQDSIAAPFVQTDWPNPTLTAHRQPSLTQNQLAADSSKGVPFAQRDWPNQTRAATQQVFEPQNLQQDEVAVPFNQSDWITPDARRVQRPETSPNLLVGSLAAPFRQADWPNPRGLRPQDPFDFPNVQQDEQAIPFAQYDWPGRRAQVWIQGDVPQNMLAADASKGVAFRQSEWPNPVRAVYLEDSLVWVQNMQMTVAITPFSRQDWSTPKQAAQHRQDGITQNTTLAMSDLGGEWIIRARRRGRR